MMEVDARTSGCNDKKPLGNSIDVKQSTGTVESNTNASAFVNQPAMAWEESRRKWTGDVSQKPASRPKDPVLSWSTSYEVLLSTSDPFPEPIPLAEMVDFLVDIWQDEDLF